MKQTHRQWFNAVPWDSVCTVNQALCKAQKLDPLTNLGGLTSARTLWDGAVARSMSLKEALDFCRECHQLSPFTFNNGNTFAAIGHTLIEDWLKTLPPVEAQIIRTTIGHYIVGLIGRGELLQVLRHFEKTWPDAATAYRETAPPVQNVPSQARA